MVYWETAQTTPNQPRFVLEWARPSVKDAITRGRPLIAGFGERIVTTPVGGHGLSKDR
jgi:hypothetical protein